MIADKEETAKVVTKMNLVMDNIAEGRNPFRQATLNKDLSLGPPIEVSIEARFTCQESELVVSEKNYI